MSYQKCPLCNGTGQYNQFNTGIISGVCPVCNGQRIISELNGLPPRPNFGQELIKDNDDIDSQYKPEDFAEYKKWLYGKKDIEEMTFTAKEYDDWLQSNRKAAKKQCSDNDIDLKIRTISFDVKMSDSDFTDLINTLEVQMKQQHESATD